MDKIVKKEKKCVFIVLRDFNTIEGVFSTKKEAEKYIKSLPDNFECRTESWNIYTNE